MWSDLPLFPEQASTSAARVDALYLFLVGVSMLMSILIAVLLITFAVRYRRASGANRTDPATGSLTLELVWTLVPFGVAMLVFVWGAGLFVHLSRPPDDTMDILVVGKRWMWKLQHLSGRREINELHVPVGRAVKLTMTSEDVIHSFYVPAFRIKSDVLPGRYTSTWFQATRPGRYHLFCAEYCGTKHSRMIGSVIVLEPDAFQAWLGGASLNAAPAQAGALLFASLGCVSCHNPSSQARGPSLEGLFGTRVALAGGTSAVADETYLRESILDPQAVITSGYQPLMPTFRGLVGEEGVMQLIEYIKSIGPPAGKMSGDGGAMPGGKTSGDGGAGATGKPCGGGGTPAGGRTSGDGVRALSGGRTSGWENGAHSTGRTFGEGGAGATGRTSGEGNRALPEGNAAHSTGRASGDGGAGATGRASGDSREVILGGETSWYGEGCPAGERYLDSEASRVRRLMSRDSEAGPIGKTSGTGRTRRFAAPVWITHSLVPAWIGQHAPWISRHAEPAGQNAAHPPPSAVTAARPERESASSTVPRSGRIGRS